MGDRRVSNWPPKKQPGFNVDQTISAEEWSNIERVGVDIEGIDFEGNLVIWRLEGGDPITIDASALHGLLSKHFDSKGYNPFEDGED